MKHENWLIAFIISIIFLVTLPFIYSDLPAYLTAEQHDMIIILYVAVLIGFDILVLSK